MPISRRSPKPSRASLSPKTPSQPHLSLAKNLTRATLSLAGNHTPICASPHQKPNAALALSCSLPSPCHCSTAPHCRRVFSRRKSQAQPRSLYCFQFNSRTNSSWDWGNRSFGLVEEQWRRRRRDQVAGWKRCRRRWDLACLQLTRMGSIAKCKGNGSLLLC